ncbi:MAG: PQQ-dependent sugar dehydrogenase [Dehalococcoidia bacterium]
MSTPRPSLLFVFALALLLAACGSGSQAAPSTPSPSPEATSAARTPAGDEPFRWGYHAGKPTGERDPPPDFVALPPGYRIETYVTGLRGPTALAFAGDGRLLVAEQAGAVRVVEGGVLQDEPFFEVEDVYMPDPNEQLVELGLVGLALGPEGAVYVYYTSDEPERRTVLARLPDGADELEEVFSLDAAPECCHIAGSVRFAPDGTLFVTVGDHQMEAEAQNRGSPFGAVLRINPDGSAPANNPFVDDEDADPRVFAYGLRNPFDFTIHPANGRMFATENGFFGQDAVLEILPGANYGWPGSGLDVPLDEVAQPLLFYHQAIGPAGIELYLDDELPVLTGALLFCQFHQGGALHAVTFNLDGSVANDSIVALGCTSDVLTGPDGFIYFLDYVSGTVYRIAS